MNSKELAQLKAKVVPLLKGEGVLKSAVFGSFVRGEQKKNSDIDLLVKFSPKKSLLDLVALKLKLEHELKRKVDVITFASVSPYLKKYIDKDKIDIL